MNKRRVFEGSMSINEL
jgi:hypothetical protein